MKKKKLELKKETIANLNNQEMNGLHGGFEIKESENICITVATCKTFCWGDDPNGGALCMEPEESSPLICPPISGPIC